MKFRKKPVTIEAVQFTGFTKDGWLSDELIKFFEGGRHWRAADDKVSLTIRTLEGDMRAKIGDWIIKGVRGEFYPCEQSIFKETYEEVKE